MRGTQEGALDCKCCVGCMCSACQCHVNVVILNGSEVVVMDDWNVARSAASVISQLMCRVE
jgi:hypothetical protein